MFSDLTFLAPKKKQKRKKKLSGMFTDLHQVLEITWLHGRASAASFLAKQQDLTFDGAVSNFLALLAQPRLKGLCCPFALVELVEQHRKTKETTKKTWNFKQFWCWQTLPARLKTPPVYKKLGAPGSSTRCSSRVHLQRYPSFARYLPAAAQAVESLGL